MTATAIVSIPNTLGLHARPAMLFVDLAGGFTADITVRRVDCFIIFGKRSSKVLNCKYAK